jgi:predicted enzyme related to lactoylglutathione lyase
LNYKYQKKERVFVIDFSQVGGVILYVNDIDQAIVFYTNVLGLEVEHYEPEYVTLKTKGVKVNLHLAENPPGPRLADSVKLPQVYFQVEDIEGALLHLQQENVRITRGITKYEPSTFVFNFLDPFGNSLACESETKH